MNQQTTPQKSNIDMKAHLARGASAWTDKQKWDSVLEQVYHYVMPNRRPASRGRFSEKDSRHIIFATGSKSAKSFASRLERDLFPPDFFKISPSEWQNYAKKDNDGAKKQELEEFEKYLEEVQLIVKMMFSNSEFGNAAIEACRDAVISSGFILVTKGNAQKPVRFVCLSIDEIALEKGPYNDVVAIFWKTKMSYRQIHAAFPNGNFSQEFREKLKSDPETRIDLHQDFFEEVKDGISTWRFAAHFGVEKEGIIAQRTYRVCPIAILPFSNIPGEAFGRGPVMDALPSIITENVAGELMFMAASYQTSGMFLYRKGGAFNPEVHKNAPGAFIPVSQSGGVMGPDIAKIDMGGNVNVSELFSDRIRQQIHDFMHDETSPARGKTPVSATEMMSHLGKVADNYSGDVSRLGQTAIPALVKAVIEVLYDAGHIKETIPLDDLFTRVHVTTPLALQEKARTQKIIIEFMQLAQAFLGPEGLSMLVKVEECLHELGSSMNFPVKLMLTQKERDTRNQQVVQAMQVATQQQHMMQEQQMQQEAQAAAPNPALQPTSMPVMA